PPVTNSTTISSEFLLINFTGSLTDSISPGEKITYVVPHTLNINSNTVPLIELFFRVKDPAEDCKISISDNHEEIASYNRSIVEPGEIESVKLPVKLINKNSDEIVVELVTGGE
ncbi:MAG: hypothetical protein ABR596_02030, partial [Halarsenatibacteraceae bacterium]